MTDTEKVGPVDHITRAVLPWRTEADFTECGKAVPLVRGRMVTRDEAAARIKRIGQRRAMFSLCMTCVSASDRHRGEGSDAVTTVARETGGVQFVQPPSPYSRESTAAKWAERQRLNAEFEAMAALVAAHREEFDGYIAGREQTVSLADRRRSRRRAGGGA